MSIWVVRAGEGSEIIEEVCAKDVIAIGWPAMGDCSGYQSREDFRQAYREAYPEDTNPYRIGLQAGQVYRFVREIAVGDTVMTPDGPVREMLIARSHRGIRSRPRKNSRPRSRSTSMRTPGRKLMNLSRISSRG